MPFAVVPLVAPMRHETPVTTVLRFSNAGPLEEPNEPPIVTIAFRGRDFEWHSNLEVPDLEQGRDFPTVTTMDDAGDGREIIDSEIQRFLSALAFVYEVGMTAPASGSAGGAQRFSRAVMRARGPAVGVRYFRAPARIVMVDDPALRHAFAHIREARGAASQFYRFLAYWNVLDVTFDGDERARDAYLEGVPERAGGLLHHHQAVPDDLAEYLRESSRNAIAHAVRRSSAMVAIDPDEPQDRQRLERDARLIEGIVDMRIHERWPHPAFVLDT